jgi:hypothetical protein
VGEHKSVGECESVSVHESQKVLIFEIESVDSSY